MKIKRIVALFLVLSTLFSFLGVVSFATEIAESESVSEAQSEENAVLETDEEQTAKSKGLVYSCVYDSDSQKILINGSVTHDIFIAHRDYTINLYKISPEASLEASPDPSDVTLLASTSISIKFNFTAKVEEIADIFSQYVVTLVSKNGTLDYEGERLYPFVESEYVANLDRANYKGVSLSDDHYELGAEPMVAIVPVYFDKLISSGATGYLYSLEGKHIFFDKEYVDFIDRTVRSLYSSGSRIYLQLLSKGDTKSAAEYDIPDVFSFSVIKEIYSYCDFLSNRYSSYKNGVIDGVILGKNLDDTQKYNNNRYGDEEKYTYALALFGVVAGVAIRKNIPSADVSYSFTNANTYGDEYSEEQGFGSSRMIEAISEYLDGFYSEGFDFSITLESSHAPLSISNDMLPDGIDIGKEYEEKHINEQNAGVFSSFLSSLGKKYSSAPKSFMYVWNVDSELRGNALSCAYTYLYYKFFSQKKLSAFVIGFNDNQSAFDDVVNILKYIDTDKGAEVTEPLLVFFGKNSWKSIITDFKFSKFATRSQNSLEIISNTPQETLGEFLYFDFSESQNYSSWFAGRGFGSISIDYHKDIGRSLCAKFSPDDLGSLEYAYLFNSYEYPENFTYTPYLTLSLAIEDNDDMPDLFEVRVAFENSGNIYEASQMVRTGESTSILLDVSSFSKKYIAENIRISVRPMSGALGEYKLFISSLKGESTELNDAELKTRIDEERLKIRDSLAETEEKKDKNIDFLIVILLFIAIIFSVGLPLFIRKIGYDEDNENESKNE